MKTFCSWHHSWLCIISISPTFSRALKYAIKISGTDLTVHSKILNQAISKGKTLLWMLTKMARGTRQEFWRYFLAKPFSTCPSTSGPSLCFPPCLSLACHIQTCAVPPAWLLPLPRWAAVLGFGPHCPLVSLSVGYRVPEYAEDVDRGGDVGLVLGHKHLQVEPLWSLQQYSQIPVLTVVYRYWWKAPFTTKAGSF